MYFCTAASENFFEQLICLIGSIHKVNFNELVEIAVYDIGLTKKQINQLKLIKKLKVYPLEITHPDLLTEFYTRPNNMKPVKGWYAWKPVVIKQALDMFPYVLYLDAGTTVLKNLSILFNHIKQEGYLLCNECQTIEQTATNTVKQYFKLENSANSWLLTSRSIRAGSQGLSRKLYTNYVLPMYNLSKNIKLFADNGSGHGGFGWCRHDQTLFSIYARKNALKTYDSTFFLFNTELHIASGYRGIKKNTIFAHTRQHYNLDYYRQFIQYKE